MLKEFHDKEKIRPFSNGTEAMLWQYENCDRCSKAFHPSGDWPKDETMKQYVSIGKECKCKYFIDWGFVTGDMPKRVAESMGYTEEKGFPRNCILFSDNDDDRFKYPKKPRPDRTPPNQLVMPFYLQEIGVKEIKQEFA